jgi:hypothetical protein
LLQTFITNFPLSHLPVAALLFRLSVQTVYADAAYFEMTKGRQKQFFGFQPQRFCWCWLLGWHAAGQERDSISENYNISLKL